VKPSIFGTFNIQNIDVDNYPFIDNILATALAKPKGLEKKLMLEFSNDIDSMLMKHLLLEYNAYIIALSIPIREEGDEFLLEHNTTFKLLESLSLDVDVIIDDVVVVTDDHDVVVIDYSSVVIDVVVVTDGVVIVADGVLVFDGVVGTDDVSVAFVVLLLSQSPSSIFSLIQLTNALTLMNTSGLSVPQYGPPRYETMPTTTCF
jgi:hypothetical protein